MERLWVKDIRVGGQAAGTFLVARKQLSSSRTGKVFLRVTLQDKTGRLDARIWDRAEELQDTFDLNDVVEVEGSVASFQGRPQLTIERIEKSPAEQNPADFEYSEPAPAKRQQDGTVEAIRQALAQVGDPHLRPLLLSFIDDPEIASRLARAPAAKEVHHAYPGGLAEHILSCIQLARRIADHYPMVDRDLLVAGAFLHDLGKIAELSWERGNTTYTDEGKLVGHLVMTAQWIHERAKTIPGFPKDLEIHLTHIVLAHHGKLEYGSPKVPATLEAYLVHALDNMDSRVHLMLSQMARSQSERWADAQKHWENPLWAGPAPTEAGKKKGPPWKGVRRRDRKKRRAAEGGERVTERPVAAEDGGRPAERKGQRAARAEAPQSKGQEEKLSFKPFTELTAEAGEEAQTPTETVAEKPVETHPATEASTPEPESAPATQEPTEASAEAPAQPEGAAAETQAAEAPTTEPPAAEPMEAPAEPAEEPKASE